MIKIAIADDEPLFRKGVAGILSGFPNYEIVYSVNNGQVLLDEIESKKIIPDIYLLDLRMKILDGVKTAKELINRFKNCKIIILSSFDKSNFVNYMLNLGVSAFLSKFIEPNELILAINKVYEEGIYLSEDCGQVIRNETETMKKPRFDNTDKLTNRELEVLRLICHSYTNQEISDKICRSIRTIEGHRQHILDKTGAKNTAGIVIYALMNQLIDLDQKLLENSLTSA